MHPASLEKVRHFRDAYIDESFHEPIRVLDVGSLTVRGGEGSRDWNYRQFFCAPRFGYTGLDLAAGANVDVVPADPYRWEEIDDESFEVAVCGQTFEHNPFFWVTMAEIARVLTPAGLVCIVAPSRGFVHRFPLDCWRFFPDAGSAMCAYVGLQLLESYVESRRFRKVTFGQLWHDFCLIGRKPILESEAERTSFYGRLTRITDTRCSIPMHTGDMVGPAIAAYERAQEASLYHVGRAYMEVGTQSLRSLYQRAVHAKSY